MPPVTLTPTQFVLNSGRLGFVVLCDCSASLVDPSLGGSSLRTAAEGVDSDGEVAEGDEIATIVAVGVFYG